MYDQTGIKKKTTKTKLDHYTGDVWKINHFEPFSPTGKIGNYYSEFKLFVY